MMITRLLPPPVASEDCRCDWPALTDHPAGGFAEEQAAVARAVPKRRAEYLLVRACARRALAELGHPPVAILNGPKREPLWPAGFTGSLTHCDGYRAAAVARTSDILSVGIDAEPNLALPEGILESVASDGERTHLGMLPPGGASWDRLLFSAKESVYKAWFPLARRWLGFEDAELTFYPGPRTFTARILVPGPVVQRRELRAFTGRWAVHDGFVITAITVPEQAPSPGLSPVGDRRGV
jgi:4'-phosphopantetheinyl transferase EntD